MNRDTIAYQGISGAFSEQAARGFSDGDAELLPCPRFEDLFDAVCSGRARKGVVPIENTLAGSVHACYDLLAKHSVAVVAEAVLRIAHALIAPPGVARESIRRVLSHPMALLQCEGFFRQNPGIEAVAVEDTAAAVKEVACGGRGGQRGDRKRSSRRVLRGRRPRGKPRRRRDELYAVPSDCSAGRPSRGR